MRRRRVEEKNGQVTTTVEESTWSPTDQQMQTVDSQVVSGEATEDVSVEDAPAKAIRLRRNDQYVEANVVQLASSGLQLAATIQDLMNRIQDNAPKFGWYLEAQTQVMQGTFSLKWGWREYASPGQMHRAFYWLCLEADIALLQVSVEMGIGVEGFGFSLQVYGQIEGEVRLKAAVQRISPEGNKGIKAVLKGEILGALGARFDAPYLVEAKGVVKTKLIVEGELRLRQDDGLRLTLDNYWNGITALVSWAVGAQTIHGKKKKEKTKSIEVVSPPEGKPGFLLSQWTWPDESRYEPERLPRSDVKAIFKEVFNAGHVILGGKYDVRVREHGHRERTDEDLFGRKEEKPDYTWWSMDEVVEAVVEKIEQRPHLEDMMEAHNEEHLETLRDPDESPDIPWRKRHLNLDWKREKKTPHLGAVEYEAFLESKEFGEMLDGYVDPIQKQLHEIEQDAANA